MKLINFFKKVTNAPVAIVFLLAITFNSIQAQQIGDPGWEFDNSKFDRRYPDMRIWATAGVQGGIPLRNNFRNRVEIGPNDDIQKAIDQMSNRSGGGVVLLKNGTYNLGTKTFRMKSNVRLRGQSKNGVKLRSRLRETNNRREKILFVFNGVKRAGLEDLSVELVLPSGTVINDDRNNPTNRHCGNCWKNNPSGKNNLYVQFIDISRNTENSWIDNCVFRNSGTNPIEVNGKHITCRNNVFDTSANKGGGGEGYYLIQGQNGLYYNETVKRLRHFVLQGAARYNVVYECDLEVDVNFHNGDRGNNLIEKNKITSLRWRSWNAFATGGARFGHDEPGPNNIIYNNDATDRDGRKRRSGSNKVYTFRGYGDPSELSNSRPSGGTLYALRRGNGNTPRPPQAPVASPTPNPTNASNGIPIGKTIWLKANQGRGDYVVAERNVDRVPLRANRSRVGTWEQFLVEDAGNGKVFLKARATNQYVQARINEESQLLASTNNRRGWETFTWESRGNNRVALKAFNNKYLSARINTVNKPLIASADQVRGWETFNWGVVSGAKELENGVNVKIKAYPNPTIDSITLESEELTALASINVSDSNGVVLQTIPLVNELNSIVIDMSNYSQGVYMLTLLSLENKAKVIKVIKE